MEAECGKVISVEGSTVIVEAEAGNGCEGCALGHQCGLGGDGRTRKIRMRNDIAARKGDRVMFSMQEKTVLFASFFLYFFPVVLLISGAAAGAYIGIPGLDRDLSAALAGIGALALSLAVIRAFSKRIEKKKSIVPVLIEIVRVESEQQ